MTIKTSKGKLQKVEIFSKVIKVLLFSAVAVIAAIYYFNGYDNKFFFVDEYYFIKKSYYFDLLFIKHDTSDPRWYGADPTGDISQPKVGPYIYGLAFHLMGIKDIQHALDDVNFNGEKINNKPWYEVMWGKFPHSFPRELYGSLELLWIARKTAIMFTVGSIVVIYSLCTSLRGSLFGLTASFLLASNALLKTAGINATTDTMQLFFFSINLLLFRKWLLASSLKSKNRFYTYSLLLGVNAALGAGVKTSGIMMVIFLGLSILLVAIIEKYYRRKIKDLVVGSLIIFTVCFSLFYYLHPFIHKDTAVALWNMYYVRTDSYKLYWSQFPYTAVTSRVQAVAVIFKRTLAPGGLFVNYPSAKLPLDTVLFVLGLIYLTIRVYKKLLIKSKFPSEAILIVWTIIVFASLVFYLKNDWGRYYLPLVACIAIFQAYLISGCIDFLLKRGLKLVKVKI